MNFKGLLRAKGKYIVAENDEKYLLRGLGIGGWLVKEGYMLHTKAPSPSTINNAFLDLLSKNDGKDFLRRYEEEFFVEEDVENISKLGFNSIRVPFHYRNFILSKNKINPYGFQILDKLLNWCKKYDLYLIIDIHCAPGSQNGQNISDDLSNDAKLYSQNKKYQPLLNFLWEEISKRYVNEDYIAGYDIVNEPVLNKENTMEDLRNSFISVAKAIRKYDNRHLLFIEGNRYATEFEGLEPPFDSNMAYSFHKYWNKCDIEAIQKFLDLRENYNVPLWMSESGENANEWFYLNIKMYEELDIGWNWWTVKKVDNITNIYNVKRPKEYSLITDYFFNNGPKPSKKKAKEILDELLENFKPSNLEFKKDCYAAIINHKLYEMGAPYEEISAPCLLELWKFDIGRVNKAYYKSLYMRDEWDKFDYNKGRGFRNDGIDIYKKEEGYEIGLNEKDEFVNYTLNFPKGDYLFKIKMRGNGRLALFLDDNLISSKAFNNDEEKLINFGKIQNIEGKHTLKIKVEKPSIFASHLDIIKI